MYNYMSEYTYKIYTYKYKNNYNNICIRIRVNILF